MKHIIRDWGIAVVAIAGGFLYAVLVYGLLPLLFFGAVAVVVLCVVAAIGYWLWHDLVRPTFERRQK